MLTIFEVGIFKKISVQDLKPEEYWDQNRLPSQRNAAMISAPPPHSSSAWIIFRRLAALPIWLCHMSTHWRAWGRIQGWIVTFLCWQEETYLCLCSPISAFTLQPRLELPAEVLANLVSQVLSKIWTAINIIILNWIWIAPGLEGFIIPVMIILFVASISVELHCLVAGYVEGKSVSEIWHSNTFSWRCFLQNNAMSNSFSSMMVKFIISFTFRKICLGLEQWTSSHEHPKFCLIEPPSWRWPPYLHISRWLMLLTLPWLVQPHWDMIKCRAWVFNVLGHDCSCYHLFLFTQLLLELIHHTHTDTVKREGIGFVGTFHAVLSYHNLLQGTVITLSRSNPWQPSWSYVAKSGVYEFVCFKI